MARQATQDTVDVSVDAVADLTALINDVRVANGTRAWCGAAGVTHGLYCLDQTSVLAVDGTNVVATFSGVGRWIYFGSGGAPSGGSIRVDTEALLTAFGVSALNDGALAYVGAPAGGAGKAQGSTWQLITKAGATPALVAHEVIASSDATRVWERQINLFNVKWVQSITWFLDGTLGDDQNDGQTNATPIKTGAELARRMAYRQVGNGGTVAITIADNIADSLDFRRVTGTVFVTAVEPTQGGAGATGLLTAAAAINRALNTFQTITAAGVNFAAFTATKSKIVLTSGTVGAWAWLESGAGGVGVLVQTSPFVTQATPTSTPVVISPAGNETYKIVSELTCVSVMTDVSPGVVAGGGFSIAVTGIKPTAQSNGDRGAIVRWNGCDLTASNFTPAASVNITLNASKVSFVSTSVPGQVIFIQGCLVIGSVVNIRGAVILLQIDTLISDATVFPSGGEIRFGACGFNNTTAGRHAIDASGQSAASFIQLTTGGALYGVLAGAGSIGFNTGKYNTIDGGGVVPTMTTTGANVAFGSVNKTWAQVPFYDSGIQGIKVNLVNGTSGAVAVPGNFTANARMVATANTPAGAGAPGVLSIPDATRNVAAKTIVVNSLIATDASSVDVVITDGPIIGNAQPALPYNFAEWL